MRKLLVTLVMFQLSAGLSVFASERPVVGIDPVFFDTAGWTWGAFEEDGAVWASDEGLLLNIEPALGGDWPDTVNGGLGISFTSDNFGTTDFDAELYQLEVTLRVLNANEARNFRIILKEPDVPATGDEFQFHFDIWDLDTDEWATLTKPLTDYNAIWTEGGDQEQAFGLQDMQLMTMWNTIDVLNIEVAGIYVKPLDPTPDGVAFELNANNFSRGWTYDAFSEPGAVINDQGTILIDVEAPDGISAFGGLGTQWTTTDVDAETHELVVRAKRGADNEAERFRVQLKDNDGLEGTDELAAESWMYEFFTEDFAEDEFTDVRVSLTDPVERQAGFGAAYDGDLELNYGFYQIELQSIWNAAERLNLEIESIRIQEIGTSIPGDFDGNGLLDAADIDILSKAVRDGSGDQQYDLNGDDLIDGGDRYTWIKDQDFKHTYVGDANLDGEFNSTDFVQVFTEGKYESGETAGWAEGDWNGDATFGSSDFVVAFTDGGYELGPQAAVSAVPEPHSIVLLLLGGLPLWMARRSR